VAGRAALERLPARLRLIIPEGIMNSIFYIIGVIVVIIVVLKVLGLY
jgi:hypothetical protein